MLSKIVTHIGVTRRSAYIKLVLFNPVFDPVEYHVRGFGALLLDCVIDDSVCSGAVSFELGGVAPFRESGAHGSVLFSIDKDGTTFSFSD
jgi:hypothetical protein